MNSLKYEPGDLVIVDRGLAEVECIEITATGTFYKLLLGGLSGTYRVQDKDIVKKVKVVDVE